MQLIWKRVKNEWFFTRTAMVLFATSAIIVMLGLGLTELRPKNAVISSSFTTQLGYSLAGISWALSALVIIVGMFRYWAVCDQSSPIVRRIWFVIMIVGLVWLVLGPALYCLAVYLPQTLRNPAKTRERACT